jgi:hypothetical protein
MLDKTEQLPRTQMRSRKIAIARPCRRVPARVYPCYTRWLADRKLRSSPPRLQVPVAFFFEGMASTPTTGAAPNASALHGSHGSALSMAQIDDFVSNSDGLRLIGAFMRIDNAALRRMIVMLLQEIAGDDGN